MLPYPQRRAAHRPPEDLLRRRRRRALPPAHRPPGAAPDGLRRVRPARRERRDPAPASTRASRPTRNDRRVQAAVSPLGHRLSTGRASSRTARPARTTAGRSGSSCSSSSTASPTRRSAGQLVPGRPDRAGQRAGRSTGAASAAARWSSRDSSSSGSSSITDYADRLLDDLDTLELARARQDDAAQLDRPLGGRRGRLPLRADLDVDYPVFTTRPDTLFGATFFVLAPEHPLVAAAGRAAPTHEDEVRDVRQRARPTRPTRSARDVDKEKTGVFTGRTVINPVNGEQIPIWVADYVLMEYGTGAIMAVPAHDERDFAFAADVRPADPPVVAPARRRARRDDAYAPYTGDGRAGELRPQFDGLRQPRGAGARSSTGSRSEGRGQARRSTTGCATG